MSYYVIDYKDRIHHELLLHDVHDYTVKRLTDKQLFDWTTFFLEVPTVHSNEFHLLLAKAFPIL